MLPVYRPFGRLVRLFGRQKTDRVRCRGAIPKPLARNKYHVRSVSLGGLVLLVVVGCGQAQIDRATLTGTVTDPTRAVVRDAKIHAKDQATGLENEAESNSQGVYRVPGLAVGTYTVTVTHTGFATAQFQDVVLLVGETRTLDAHLKVGAVMQR